MLLKKKICFILLLINFMTGQEPPSRAQTTTQETIGYGSLKSNQNRKYAVYIPKGFDFNKEAVVILYFHGQSSNHNKIKLLKNKIPSNKNIVLLVPHLSYRPQKSHIRVEPSFVEDVIEDLCIKWKKRLRVKNIKTYAHSAGGRPMSRYLNSLTDEKLKDISNMTYLDATYGWNITRKLISRLVSINYDASKIHFIVKTGSVTEKNAKRHSRIGARLTKVKMGHSKIAYEL